MLVGWFVLQEAESGSLCLNSDRGGGFSEARSTERDRTGAKTGG